MKHSAETKALGMIATRTTAELITDWQESEKQPISADLATVRGWLMDELEKRHRTAFDTWMERGGEPEKYFLPSPVVALTCCCCTRDTIGRQWHNRDAGYGLCTDCTVSIAKKESAEEMLSSYGIPGKHYNI